MLGAHIFGRRKRGDREEVGLRLFDDDGEEIFITGEGVQGPTGPPGPPSVLVQEDEPSDVPVNTLWVEIDNADPPNIVALHVAVAE